MSGQQSEKKQSAWKQVFKKLLTDPMGTIGTGIIVTIAFLAIFAPLLTSFNPIEQFPGKELLPPGSEKFLLGTDEFGRDIFSRLIYGARISLLVSILTVLFSTLIGVPAGLTAGYFGGKTERVIMGLCDVVIAYPALLLGMAIMVIIGPAPLNIAYALTIVNIPKIARLMRSSVLVQKESEYVKNAESVGCSNFRIISRHILPNSLAPILVQLSLTMGFAVLTEASLSYLGLGAQPPLPSWGAMLKDGRSFIYEAWWYSVYPGIAISLFLFGLSLFSDALRKAADPKSLA